LVVISKIWLYLFDKALAFVRSHPRVKVVLGVEPSYYRECGRGTISSSHF
jgi:hypothetical protein